MRDNASLVNHWATPQVTPLWNSPLHWQAASQDSTLDPPGTQWKVTTQSCKLHGQLTCLHSLPPPLPLPLPVSFPFWYILLHGSEHSLKFLPLHTFNMTRLKQEDTRGILTSTVESSVWHSWTAFRYVWCVSFDLRPLRINAACHYWNLYSKVLYYNTKQLRGHTIWDNTADMYSLGSSNALGNLIV